MSNKKRYFEQKKWFIGHFDIAFREIRRLGPDKTLGYLNK